MSATRIIALRSWGSAIRPPLPASQLQRFCAARPSPTAPRRRATGRLVNIQPRRQQSSGRKEPEPKPLPWKEIMAILRRGLHFRPLFNQFRGQNLRNLYRQSPEELVIAFVILACTGAMIVYVIYAYFHYFQSEQFTRFPPEIATSLRRALYYSNYGPDPQLALKYYKKALEQCDELGIDPFSDEVLGVKIQLAAWLERNLGKYPEAIEVLEAILRDCKRWVQKMEQAVRDGLIDNAGNWLGPAGPKTEEKKEEGSDSGVIEPPPENLWAKRRRLLGRSVGISVKLGELYADEHVLKGGPAEERLVWAVETVLKELQRRHVQGVKENEGDWMSPEEIGGAMEALANNYESKSQHYLAAPLFLQALTLSPPSSCHTAVLMNNLAISLAQQPVAVPTESRSVQNPEDAEPGQPTRATLLASARSWALQAQATGAKVQGEDRTPECDEACAVALYNLGEIAAMSGDLDEAKRRFRECLALSKEIDFTPGVVQAQERLEVASKKKPAKGGR